MSPIVEPIEASFASAAVLADAHLSRDEEGLGRFEQLLAGLPDRVEALVLLGDLFEIWVALPHLMEAHHRRILQSLRDAAARGLPVYYIEGNRDFLVDRLSCSPFRAVRRELGLSVAGRRIRFLHGDGLDPMDTQYRRWAALSRSLPVRLLVRAVPGRWGRSWIRRTERRMRRTNLDMKERFPEDALRACLAQSAEAGCDLTLLGHFHRVHELLREDAVLQVLPAWMDDGSWLLINEAGARLQPAAS